MSTFWLVLSSIFVILTLLFYSYVRYRQSYWKRRNISGPAPYFFLGNTMESFFKPIPSIELEWSRKYGKIYGTYTALQPRLTILDSALIKQVLVKDFPTFSNRTKSNTYHKIWNQNLFSGSQGEQWKKIRTIVSPTFTSGKLRGMSLLMDKCTKNLCNYLQNVSSGEIDVRKVIAGFTIDVIASTAFATDTNSNALDEKERSANAFLSNSLSLFRVPPLRALSTLVMPIWFNTFFGIYFGFPPQAFDFFVNLTSTIIKKRRNNNSERRNDLVQLLLDTSVDEKVISDTTAKGYDTLTASIDEDTSDTSDSAQSQGQNEPLPPPPTTKTSVAKKPHHQKQQKLTENEIIAQCIIFFIAGFETTATTLTYLLYELAVNPPIQDRLVNEFNQALANVVEDSEEYFTIVLQKIPYLDAVIKETLRKYPPVIRLNRHCNVDNYQLGSVRLYKGQLVEIPTYAVHHSPEYYPEPERYNPERFMPENKHLLVPYTYIPFGDGPRNCIGMRFAYQEIKLCLAKVIRRFRFSPTAHTKIPLEFAKSKTLLLSVNDMPLRVKQRC